MVIGFEFIYGRFSIIQLVLECGKSHCLSCDSGFGRGADDAHHADDDCSRSGWREIRQVNGDCGFTGSDRSDSRPRFRRDDNPRSELALDFLCEYSGLLDCVIPCR
ncbi:hypothetical protein D3C81_741220 [compost metagenome]